MVKNKSRTLALLVFSSLLFLGSCASNSSNQVDSGANKPDVEETAQVKSSQIQVFVDDKGQAILGTDPVAYFTQNSPVAGKSEFTYDWSGATWLFATQENRDLFAANPEKYAPQYGGFCAWAVSQGSTAPIDPQAWKIVDGKLYLNFNKGIQSRWEQDIPGNIAKANSNWPGVLK